MELEIRQTDEPAQQQVVVELLHQLSFRAHGVERLQQQRLQQPLWRNRRPAMAGVKPGKAARQILQCRVNEVADRTQRMIRRNALFQPQ